MSPRDEPPKKICPKCNGRAELLPWETRSDRETFYQTFRCPRCGHTWEISAPIKAK